MLYEEFVSLLIYMCAERYTQGLADVTLEEIARREVVHLLAAGAKPHSKIQKYLPDEVSVGRFKIMQGCCQSFAFYAF